MKKLKTLLLAHRYFLNLQLIFFSWLYENGNIKFADMKTALVEKTLIF